MWGERDSGKGGVCGERETLVREGLVWGEGDSGEGGVSVGRETGEGGVSEVWRVTVLRWDRAGVRQTKHSSSV